MKLSRRGFLAAGMSTALALGHIRQLVFAAEPAEKGDILVLVFLRGGYDALNVLAPVDDPNYKAARAVETRIAESGVAKGIALKNAYSGNDFRLHPRALPLKELYDSGDLAFIHACGVPNGTRSHFDAQSLIERGTSDDNAKRIGSGWLTRHLLSSNAKGMIPAFSSSGTLPESLHDYKNTCCINEIESFAFPAHWKYGAQQKQILRAAYAGTGPLAQAGIRALDTLDFISNRVKKDANGNPLPYQPLNQAQYPGQDYAAELSNSLQLVGRLIRMGVGLQVAAVDFDGWDTHQGQADIFPNLLDALSRALSAFYTDMAAYKNRLTVAVISEFGRRLKQNESYGTDHGHASLMIVLGGHVNGGRVYGTWPGLATEQLDQGADLQVTTDYRSVLAEIVSKRLGNQRVDLVFPRFQATSLDIFRP